MAFFGITVNFIIQKLKSKHLVFLSFLWCQVFLREWEQNILHIPGLKLLLVIRKYIKIFLWKICWFLEKCTVRPRLNLTLGPDWDNAILSALGFMRPTSKFTRVELSKCICNLPRRASGTSDWRLLGSLLDSCTPRVWMWRDLEGLKRIK